MNQDQLSYGADQSGLICGYLFEEGQAGRSLHTKEALVYLSVSETTEGSDKTKHLTTQA